MQRILVIADTHVRTVRDLPGAVLEAVAASDCVVHCGDFTHPAVIEELTRLASRFIGVYGNSDPGDVRRRLPHETTFELAGKRIAVNHPHWGGYPDGIEEALVARFTDVDAILFGHTHEPRTRRIGDTLLLNPGQAYDSFMVPASIGYLTIDGDRIWGEVSVIG